MYTSYIPPNRNLVKCIFWFLEGVYLTFFYLTVPLLDEDPVLCYYSLFTSLPLFWCVSISETYDSLTKSPVST